MKMATGKHRGDFEVRQQLAKVLRGEGHDVIDPCDKVLTPNNGCRDYAISLGRAALSSIHFAGRNGDEDTDFACVVLWRPHDRSRYCLGVHTELL